MLLKMSGRGRYRDRAHTTSGVEAQPGRGVMEEAEIRRQLHANSYWTDATLAVWRRAGYKSESAARSSPNHRTSTITGLTSITSYRTPAMICSTWRLRAALATSLSTRLRSSTVRFGPKRIPPCAPRSYCAPPVYIASIREVTRSSRLAEDLRLLRLLDEKPVLPL